MKNLLRALALTLLLSTATAAADTLMIDVIERERGAQIERPQRGLTMVDVENRFGEPEVRVPAVGEPPISRWIYSDLTVFFEYNRVLHSVPRR